MFALITPDATIAQFEEVPFDVPEPAHWIDLGDMDPLPHWGDIASHDGGDPGSWSFAPPPPPVLTPDEIKQNLLNAANAAYAASDSVIMQFYEQDVPVSADWKAYRTALRLIIKTASGTMPTRPTTEPPS